MMTANDAYYTMKANHDALIRLGRIEHIKDALNTMDADARAEVMEHLKSLDTERTDSGTTAFVLSDNDDAPMVTTHESDMLPAGDYYVGDLCYVLEGDIWNAMIESSTPHGKVDVITVDGQSYLSSSVETAHGDGTYYDQHGFEYGVDSGTIGVVDARINNYKNMSGAHLVHFNEPFKVSYDRESGVISIGDLRIPTDD